MKLLNRLFIALTVAGPATMLVSVSAHAGGLTVDTAGNLFVAAGHFVSKFTVDGTKSTFATGFAEPLGLSFESEDYIRGHWPVRKKLHAILGRFQPQRFFLEGFASCQGFTLCRRKNALTKKYNQFARRCTSRAWAIAVRDFGTYGFLFVRVRAAELSEGSGASCICAFGVRALSSGISIFP